MARFSGENLRALSEKIRANDTVINRAASLAINKTLTFTKDLSTSFIIQEANLQRSYVARNLKTAQRASPNNLFGIIRANTRETLLTRYPNQDTENGVRVAVNASGGYRTIERAFRVSNLRGSNANGIALRNIDAAQAFRKAIGQRTPGKSRKLQRLISNARTRPRGITVLHSRSINQLFTSVREDVQPRSNRFLADTFIQDVFRLQGSL